MHELVERIRADQREQWLRGNRIQIEEYLTHHPDLAGREEDTLDLIYGEVLLREELGERVAAAEYLERFPQFAHRLRKQFEIHEMMRDSGPPDGDTLKEAPLTKRTRPTFDWPFIPGYEILEQFPSGGQGVVYKARQVDLNRVVALKMVRHDEDAADPKRQELFRREAETVARLNHPHVVQIYDFGEHRGRFYFTMEFVEGGSLDRRLAGGTLPPREAAELAETLARALHAVHEQGVVHRDLKPANVLLTAAGTPKVADFGLAKWLNRDASLTPYGAIVGTASYMAPEQAAGQLEEVAAPADVYSLGAILYQILTGRPPFRDCSFLSTLRQVLSRDPAPLQLGRANRDLGAICLKCLEKEPARRYASAEALAEDLRRFLDGKPTLARPPHWYENAWRVARRRPALGAAALLCLVLPAALPLTSSAPPQDPDRERKQAEAKLAAGKPFRFDGIEPLPGPFRSLSSPPISFQHLAATTGFALGSFDPLLLELVSDPGSDCYEFSTAIRHNEEVRGTSEVGIFFGFRRAGDRSRYGYYTLSFADIGFLTERATENGQPSSSLEIAGYVQGAGAFHRFHEEDPTVLRFRPARARADGDIWRRIGVRVTPEGVTPFWQDEQGRWMPGKLIPAARLEKYLQRLTAKHPHVAGIPTNFSPRAGLGLYVNRAEGWFRHVVLVPMTAK
jgi:serine/threonine protein kinase